MKKFALILSVVLMCACAAQRPPYIPQEDSHKTTEKEYRLDTIYIDRWHTEQKKGDTVIIHDSINIYKVKRDSILYGDTTTKAPILIEKEKELTKHQEFMIKSGVALWIILAVVILAIVIGIIIKFAK